VRGAVVQERVNAGAEQPNQHVAGKGVLLAEMVEVLECFACSSLAQV
jgi:hypothetical protein